jgi:hypothetical protein
MALLNFPPNPTVGQIFTIGVNSWQWTGSAWIKYNSGNSNINTLTAGSATITTSTNSTSTTTGALVVNGGVGIGGNVNIGGNLNVTGTITISTSSGITLQTVTSAGAITNKQVYFTNTTNSTSTYTGSVVFSGGVAVQEDMFIWGRANCESLRITDAIFDSTLITTSTSAIVLIDSYSLNSFRSAKYLIQIDSGTGPTANFHVTELLLLVDNNGTVYATEYAVLTSSAGELGTFSALFNAGNSTVNLYFTPAVFGVYEAVVLRTALAV